VPLFAERYELGPIIGRGGMAEVLAARDTRLDRPVAIKIMRPELAHHPLVRDRFESEARLAARLIHPNVVAVFDSGEQEGSPFIVMERLPGDTLHDRLASGPMSEPEVRQLAVEILAALETAHAAGILHRDIKPANVLAAGGGHWKVADFGIAKALEVDQGDATVADATATGLVLGTPAYLAPERLFGAPATVASDLFALGVVLYEALAGRRPFDTGAAPEAWPGVVAGAPLVPLAQVRPGVDPVMAAAIERSLAREPSERFWSAAEMAATIGRPGGVIRPDAAGAPATVAMAAAAAGPATAILPRPASWPAAILASEHGSTRRSPAAVLLAAVAALAVAAAVILAVIAADHGAHGGSPATSHSTKGQTTGATAPSTLPAPSTTSSTTSTTIPPPVTPPKPPPKGGDGGDGGGKGH
jgi:serine/threonine protein kinase